MAFCLRSEKKIDWFLNGISRDDFDTNVKFFSTSNQLFPCPTGSINCYPLCLARSSRVICIVNSISFLDELFLLLEEMW